MKNNSKILKEAVAISGRYSPNHIKVFNVLMDYAVDGKIVLPVKDIQELSNMKRSSVYFALNSFQKDGLLVKDKRQMGAFVLQKDQMDFLVASYMKRKNRV